MMLYLWFCHMARSKPSLQIHLEYWPVRGVAAFVRRLPLDSATRISRNIIKFILLFIPLRKKLVRGNLASAFPELSEPEREAILSESLNNLARMIAIFPRMPELTREGLPAWVSIEGLEHVRKAREEGHGVIAFTAHLGLWEFMAVCCSRLIHDVRLIVRPLDNARIDAYCTSLRSCTGAAIIPHRQALRQGLRCLKDHGVLGILIDQNFSAGGIFVDFFGRLAATSSIVSILARRTDAVILPLHNRWEENGRLKIIFDPPVPLSQNSNTEMAVAEDTYGLTKIVEGWIRQDPGQWFWLHNRWKRRPQPGEFVYMPEGPTQQNFGF
jgi:KDO2-lipid IV(A) lauroyltransferase